MSATTLHPEHAHVHGSECGHPSIDHDGHTDFLHDGHAHRVDGDDVVECDVSDLHVEAESHDHEHNQDCGHDAVTHGDHVDYVHDGHRHAAHQGHYDEH